MGVIAVFPPNFSEVSNAPPNTTLIVNIKKDNVKETIVQLGLLIKRTWNGTVAFNWEGDQNFVDTVVAQCRVKYYFFKKQCKTRFNK